MKVQGNRYINNPEMIKNKVEKKAKPAATKDQVQAVLFEAGTATWSPALESRPHDPKFTASMESGRSSVMIK